MVADVGFDDYCCRLHIRVACKCEGALLVEDRNSVWKPVAVSSLERTLPDATEAVVVNARESDPDAGCLVVLHRLGEDRRSKFPRKRIERIDEVYRNVYGCTRTQC